MSSAIVSSVVIYDAASYYYGQRVPAWPVTDNVR